MFVCIYIYIIYYFIYIYIEINQGEFLLDRQSLFKQVEPVFWTNIFFSHSVPPTCPARFAWITIAIPFFLYLFKVLLKYVKTQSSLWALKIPTLGKLTHKITPWSSADCTSAMSDSVSSIHPFNSGITVLTASGDLPGKSLRVLDRYSLTHFHALWCCSCSIKSQCGRTLHQLDHSRNNGREHYFEKHVSPKGLDP